MSAMPCAGAPVAESAWKAMVLHDLRGPLSVVSLEVQLLRRSATAERTPAGEPAVLLRRADRIAHAVAQIAGMLDELQGVRGGEGGPQLRRERTDVVEIVRGAAAERAEHAPNHRLVVRGAEVPLVGYWDRGHLERAIGNLLGNAVKYSPRGGEVALDVWREPRPGAAWAVVQVVDQGVGIPAADLPRVFEPFYRAANVAERFEGTGLGLAGVRQVAEQHGGSVSVESTEGRGTSVTLRLPLAADA